MLQMVMYMAEVMQIIGAVVLIAIGVGVILYTLIRKSPTAAKEDETRALEDAEDASAEDAEDVSAEDAGETPDAEDAETDGDAR